MTLFYEDGFELRGIKNINYSAMILAYYYFNFNDCRHIYYFLGNSKESSRQSIDD